jgi:enterochelin esterase-like enzyme
MKFRSLLTGIVVIFVILLFMNGFAIKSIIASVYSPGVKEVKIYSQSLEKHMKLVIYTPPNYNTKRKYPVLYLLHGKDGNQNSWMNGFLGISAVKINEKADKLIKAYKIEPLIIVAPQIDNSYGVNTASVTKEMGGNNLGMYENYIVKDVVRYVDSHFSTMPNRESRYIGGLSMGGFAALHVGFLHPDLFSKVGGHSPALRKDPTAGSNISWLMPNEEERSKQDPLYIAKKRPLNDLQVYLDSGEMDHDWLIEGNEVMFRTLQEAGVKVHNKLNEGGHDFKYWSSQAENYLIFYAGTR